MKNGMLRLILALLLAVSLAGCFGSKRNKLSENPLSRFGKDKVLKDAKEEDDYKSAQDMGVDSTFEFGTDQGIVGGMSGGRGKTKQDIRGDMLFAGALDVVLNLPVQVASREGGFISTGWKISPKDPTSRFKLNIRVSGQDPFGVVKVVVLKQQRQGDQWVDAQADAKLAENIQKSIRKRAKAMRP